jgi:hypothetical protein
MPLGDERLSKLKVSVPAKAEGAIMNNMFSIFKDKTEVKLCTYDSKAEDTNRKHQQLECELYRVYRRYKSNVLFWVSLYRGLLITSALMSVSAAVVIKLSSIPDNPQQPGQMSRTDIAAILAAVSTTATTLFGVLDVAHSWRADRRARDSVKELQLELLREKPDYDAIISSFKSIMETRIADSTSTIPSGPVPDDTIGSELR